MPEVIPFRGVRYNKETINPIESVVAPPYDEISEQKQEELYLANPYNIVRLILRKDMPDDTQNENKYIQAARDWKDWQEKGILHQDKKPAFYIYEQEFTLPSGGKKSRRGFLGRARLECLDSGRIKPHENTHNAPIEDRLRLIRECRANLSPVFAIYDDPDRKIDRFLTTEKSPEIDFADPDGIRHRLWTLNDSEKIAGIQQAIKGKETFIADGHHRYTTALRYLDEQKRETPNLSPDDSVNFIMMMFVNLHNESLVILPFHRLIQLSTDIEETSFMERLENEFLIESFSTNDCSIKKYSGRIAEGKKEYHRFGLILPGNRLFVLTLKDTKGNPLSKAITGELDVKILHMRIMENILGIPSGDPEKKHVHYTSHADVAWNDVQENRYRMAFLLNPTRVEEVEAVVSARGRMPQKSTFFYPKLLSGLVMHKIDE